MTTMLGGYREYKSETATDTTHTTNLDKIDQYHKVYVDLVSFRSDRANADVVVYLVSGGEEYLIAEYKNISADLGEVEEVKTWLYTGESLRFYWSGIQSGDVVEVWAVGVDKWTPEELEARPRDS